MPNQSLLAGLITNSAPYNTRIPYLGYGFIILAENAGNGHYNGLQVSLRSQIKRDLSLNVAYTYSSAIDPTTDG